MVDGSWMQEDFLPPLEAEQRPRRSIRPSHLRVADGRITALVELFKALRVKFYQNIRAGAGLILKEVPDPSNVRPQLATIKGFGAFSDLEVAFLKYVRRWCAAHSRHPGRSGPWCRAGKRGRSPTECTKSDSNSTHPPSSSLTFHPSLRIISICS